MYSNFCKKCKNNFFCPNMLHKLCLWKCLNMQIGIRLISSVIVHFILKFSLGNLSSSNFRSAIWQRYPIYIQFVTVAKSLVIFWQSVNIYHEKNQVFSQTCQLFKRFAKNSAVLKNTHVISTFGLTFRKFSSFVSSGRSKKGEEGTYVICRIWYSDHRRKKSSREF